jgi:O-antigen ligase
MAASVRIGNSKAVVAFAAALALALGIVLVLLLDASITWQVLVLAALCCFAALFWSRNVESFLLFMYAVTVSIDLSKALIVQGGIYSPGLSLFLSDLFFLPLLGLWLWRHLVVECRAPRLDGLQKFALVLLAWLWFTALISEDELAGVLAAITYTKYYCMYLIVASMVRDEARLRLILGASAVTLTIHLLFAALQVLSGGAIDLQGLKPTNVGVNLVFEAAGGVSAFRPSGFFAHPNVLADYLAFVLPCALALVTLGRRALGRAWPLALILTLLSVAVLVLTLSRGGWIATAVALVVMLAVGARKGLIEVRRIAAIAGVAGCLLAIVAIVYPAAYLRITESDLRSSEARLAMMDQALLIIERNPVYGVGLGGYNRAAQNNIPESYSSLSPHFQAELLKGVVHNKYLLVTAEHGFIGLALFLAVMWRHLALFASLPAWRGNLQSALALGITGAIAGQLVFYLFDHFYLDVRVELMWFFFATLVAMARLQRRAAVRPLPAPVSPGAGVPA